MQCLSQGSLQQSRERKNVRIYEKKESKKDLVEEVENKRSNVRTIERINALGLKEV